MIGRNIRRVTTTGSILLAFSNGHLIIHKSDNLSKKDVAEALAATLNRIAEEPDLGVDVASLSLGPEDRAQMDLLENPHDAPRRA
jgi:hypothetical protein